MEQDRSLPPGCPQPPLPLADLKRADNFTDVVVRVVSIDNESEPARLLLWDGSGDAHASDQRLVEPTRDRGVTLPEKGVVIELTMDSCWSIVQEMGFIGNKLLGGQWCRFRNVAVTPSDMLSGHGGARPEVLRFREVSSLMLVPDYVPEVKERLHIFQEPVNTAPQAVRAHESAVSSTTSVRLMVPEHILKNVPVSSLAEVARAAQVPRKYHCLARFTKIWPSDITKIAKTKAVNSTEFVYSFAVTIEDDTGTLDVIVYGTDAVRRLS